MTWKDGYDENFYAKLPTLNFTSMNSLTFMWGCKKKNCGSELAPD
jgi:hypothetical protein